MDLRTSNILTCPTCRTYFSPDVKQLIKNFTILDYLYSEKANVLMQQLEANKNNSNGAAADVAGGSNQNQSGISEEAKLMAEAYCTKHPQKKTKYFCETDQVAVCSKCIIGEHKGHRICDILDNNNVKVFQKRAQILKKKIDASAGETEIFTEELEAIEE